MSRKYGEEQRKAVREIRENLIKKLEETYLEAFNQLNTAGLGDGTIARVAQLFLMSRHEAINILEEETVAGQNIENNS